jgi:uncharacterized membrane protein
MSQTETVGPSAPPSPRRRLAGIDLCRGSVMVLMALDHARAFFHTDAALYSPTDLAQTSPAVFLTRWITHFCAPAFVVLAGLGAYLYKARGRSRLQLSGFLLTRGLWLVLLELTVIQYAWNFDWNYRVGLTGGVIWALGWSMAALAALCLFPWWLIIGVAGGILGTHNLFDVVTAESLGQAAWLWRLLHEPGPFAIAPGITFTVSYPVLPWIGVMALGYSLGRFAVMDAAIRRRIFAGLGMAFIGGFLVLRYQNDFGGARPWTIHPDPVLTLFSFINCVKYPPSLVYLLMTLGPVLLLLALLDVSRPGLLRPLAVFGRVPLFFYILHLFLIHGLAAILAIRRYGKAPWLFETPPPGVYPFSPPAGYGYDLPAVYGLWLLVLVALFPFCAWFARVKERRSWAWLSYV